MNNKFAIGENVKATETAKKHAKARDETVPDSTGVVVGYIVVFPNSNDRFIFHKPGELVRAETQNLAPDDVLGSDLEVVLEKEIFSTCAKRIKASEKEQLAAQKRVNEKLKKISRELYQVRQEAKRLKRRLGADTDSWWRNNEPPPWDSSTD